METEFTEFIESEQRVIELEKALLEQEWELFKREQSVAHRELEVAKRESHYISEMRNLYTIKEKYLLSTKQSQDETKKLALKKLELESVHQQLEKSKEALLETTQRLKEKKREHWKREMELNNDISSDLVLKKKINELREKENERAMEIQQEKFFQLIKKARTEPLMIQTEGFRLIPSEKGSISSLSSLSAWELDYPENDIFFYRDNFMKESTTYAELEKARKWLSFDNKLTNVKPEEFQEHINLLLQESDDDVAVISIKKTCDSNRNILGLTRTKMGDQPFLLPMESRVVSKVTTVARNKPPGLYSTKEIITSFRKQFPVFQASVIPVVSCKKECALPNDLLELDRTLKTQSYKFGLLYFSENTVNHERFSPEFQTFLDFMGDKIKLKGWCGYKADLDSTLNKTGTHSYYTEWFGHDIMFHVAPLLPEDCRDRLIGNDIVWFVWIQDGVWDPNLILSQVNHCQVLLRPVPAQDRSTFLLRVGIAARVGVPASTPPLYEGEHELNEDLRDFLLRKALNLERASWHCESTIRSQSKSLQDHLELTRRGQLCYMVKKYRSTAREF
eukprot:TRINITY_DN857_c0_g1_i1.p1 TRINITY_DN857_c0_g1~~TRINITY_DN857_c0_g1_i1.p1  ORF type:complete len:563 (-),score=73.52 TRINITY_DN857_c0_g1_i1:2558-4246(-)